MPVTAVILAGGLGTRIRGVLPNTPKTLAPVNGEPFLTRLFDQLLEAGVTEAVLCVGYLGEQIQERFGSNYRALSISYSAEHQPLGTAGALRKALPILKSKKLLLMNGDSCVATPLRPFIDLHAAAGCGAMILAWVEDCSRYGTVEIGHEDRLMAFREKDGQVRAGWINAGVYILPAAWLSELPANVELSLELQVLPTWCSRGISAFKAKAPFIDIGTPETLSRAEHFFRQSSFQPSFATE